MSTVGMLAELEESYVRGYFQPKLFLLHPSSKPLVCYLSSLLSSSFSPFALERGFTDFHQIFPKKIFGISKSTFFLQAPHCPRD
jgi:hypothetical protein